MSKFDEYRAKQKEYFEWVATLHRIQGHVKKLGDEMDKAYQELIDDNCMIPDDPVEGNKDEETHT